MALIKCWECGAEVSSSAAACPRCGASPRQDGPVAEVQPPQAPPPAPAATPQAPPARSPLRTVLTAVGILVAVGLVWLAFSLYSGPKQIGPSGKIKTRNTICDKGGLVIHEDQFWSQQFKITRDHELEISVRESVGPPLDIFLLTPMEFGSFKAGGKFKFLTAFSQGNTRDFTRKATIAAGEYVLVVDNSDVGDARPPMNASDDAGTVDVRVSAD